MSVVPINDAGIKKELREDSYEEFLKLLQEGIETLGLDSVAAHFSVTSETLERWQNIQSAPVPIIRAAYIAELKVLLKQP